MCLVFPSFWSHIGENVRQQRLNTYGRLRIQLVCNVCGLHLGYLFDHSLTPTKVRYCINADAIQLV
ncbi:peptide-methionine (R)-S-oxide reductase [Pontibacter toksunensis]|uniref:peptide-methionine (R)-S-oxide reductase n=1 Tax=Pontibacter toksunensis TaxID=1332631 RepID=A0ABW6BVA9_9BACT